MKNKLRLFSAFSGIGAFEKGLKNNGIEYELVAYSEFDKYASKAYSLIHNEPEEKNWGDINKINEKELPDFDLMTYGFPCQSFSIQGERLGFDDPEKGNLFFESMRIAREKKPKYLIAENVKGLVNHDKGRTLQTVLKTLEWLGYNNYYEVLNSVNFDVPQSRERIFIVSIRKDIDTGLFRFPKGQMTTKVVADIIDHTNQNRHLKDSLKPFLDKSYHREYQSENGIKKVFDGNVQGFFNSDYTGKRLYSIYGCCPTLTANKLNSFNFVEIGGELSALEWMRLQGFEDEDYFKIEKHIPESQIKKQAGNSITVNVIQKIFANLMVAQGEITKEEILTYIKSA